MFGYNVHCLSRVYVYETYDVMPIRSKVDISEDWFIRFGDQAKRIFTEIIDKASDTPDFLLMPTIAALSKNKLKTYNPDAEAEDMFTEFIKVDRLNPRSILRFIENFGLPFGVSASQKPYPHINNVCMLASEFAYAEGFKGHVHLWEAISLNDSAAAKRYFNREYKDGIPKELESLDNYIDKARTLLTLFIKNIGFSSYENINGRIVPIVAFDHLGRVAYNQLAKAILGNHRIRTCEHCGLPFEVRNDNRKFCPPLPGKKRSTCENTHNTSLKRGRRKETNNKTKKGMNLNG